MRAASVGQQCVECVKAGGQSAPPARTAFGGRVASGGGRPAVGAIVTFSLIAINVGLFIVELAKPSLATDWGMVAGYTQDGSPHGVVAGEWYRLITSAFLPPAVTGGGGLGGLGFMDILFNMWALVFVGPALERLLGSLRFLGVYVVSALGGSVMYYYLAAPNAIALGASGAIFGLFGAWFVASRRLRLDARGISTLIVINLVISFVWRSTIAWQAHVGGLLAGALLTAAYAYAPRKNRGLLQVAATAAIVALIVVAVAIRTHQLQR
ncbi:MAG: rhomboid family intramembrane serine protease [Streptosporangiaceae bacterium]|nr:rhomboid family intramembrane serine protease [Streptosporangiaceae bacterium]